MLSLEKNLSCWLSGSCIQSIFLDRKENEDQFEDLSVCQYVQYESHSGEFTMPGRSFGIMRVGSELGSHEEILAALKALEAKQECIDFLISANEEDMARS